MSRNFPRPDAHPESLRHTFAEIISYETELILFTFRHAFQIVSFIVFIKFYLSY